MKTPDPKTASLEELLAHSGWVQALAKSLLADEHQAEDVSQQTLMVALERKPYGGAGLQAWLTRVARGIALNLRRGERRRLAREEKVAQTGATAASSDEIVAWAECMHELALAVSSLDEPHRSIIVQRYFDGLPLHEIASRLGMPASTVRSNLRRSLQKLKFELQARSGKESHLAGLAILAAPISGTTVLASAGSISFTPWITHLLLMSTKTKIAFSAALLLLISWAVWPTPRLSPPTIQTVGNADPIASTSILKENATIPQGEATDESLRVELLEESNSIEAVFHVQVLDLNGRAIPQAHVEAKNIHQDWIKLMGFKGWDAWFHIAPSKEKALTDEFGRATLNNLNNSDPVIIYAFKSGFAIAGKLHDSTPGKPEQDCGILSLSPGGQIKLRVLDNKNKPVEGAVISLQTDPTEPVGTLYFQSGPTDDKGEKSFPHLLNRLHRLEINAPGFIPFQQDDFQPIASSDQWRQITLERGSAINGIVFNSNHSPAADVPIYLLRKEDSSFDRPHQFYGHSAVTQTDVNGEFEISGLDDKEAEYKALAKVSPTIWTASDPVSPGGVVKLSLPDYYSIRGKIVIEDGSPAQRASIGFVNVDHPGDVNEVFYPTSSNGSFQLAIAAGTYGAMARNREGRKLLSPFEVSADVDLGEITIFPGVPLTITTLSSIDKKPVPFPSHILDVEVPYFGKGIVIGPNDWKRQIKHAARARRFSRDQFLEDHVAIIKYLPPGNHDLSAHATGYLRQPFKVILEEGKPKAITLFLEPTLEVTLIIKDKNGLPVQDQEFLMNSFRPDGKADEDRNSERSSTNAAGKAIFNQLSKGWYYLCQGSGPTEVRMTSLEIVSGENIIEYQYPTQPNLTVRLSDASGPITGTEIQILKQLDDNSPWPKRAQLDSKGEAHFSNIWPGNYRIMAEVHGSLRVFKVVELNKESEVVELQLSGITIKGKIPSENLTLLGGLRVSIHGHGLPISKIKDADLAVLGQTNYKSSLHGTAMVDEDGNFIIQNVQPGLYEIYMDAKGYRSSGTTEIEVYTQDLIAPDLSPLIMESVLILQVIDSAEFVATNSVHLFYGKLFNDAGVLVANTSFSDDGEKKFDRLNPGKYDLKIYSVILRGGKETLVDTIPVQVGGPSTVTTTRWPL